MRRWSSITGTLIVRHRPGEQPLGSGRPTKSAGAAVVPARYSQCGAVLQPRRMCCPVRLRPTVPGGRPFLAQPAIERLQAVAYEVVPDGDFYRNRQNPGLDIGTQPRPPPTDTHIPLQCKAAGVHRCRLAGPGPLPLEPVAP